LILIHAAWKEKNWKQIHSSVLFPSISGKKLLCKTVDIRDKVERNFLKHQFEDWTTKQTKTWK